MAKAAVLGKTTKADLPKELFAEPFHQSLVHEAARADLAARRRGTASTLTRGEVSFTTAKAWRQKGTGRARAGTLGVAQPLRRRRRLRPEAAPLHRQGQPQSAPQGDARGALGPRRARQHRRPRRRRLRHALDQGRRRRRWTKWGAKRPTLVVLDAEETGAVKSFRNIPRVQVAEVGAIGVADVIGAASLVVSEAPSRSSKERLG